MSEKYVLRIARSNTHSNYAREAQLAQLAARLGVKTALCIAFENDYSIWQRLPGIRSDRKTSDTGVWQDLLTDLEKIHQQPLEPQPENLTNEWISHEFLLESTQNAAVWSLTERKIIERVLNTKHPIANNTFIHGDAWQENVLEFNGQYAGLIDWNGAGWSCLEFECSRLENPALKLALKRWQSRLDLELVWKMRLELLLKVSATRRVDWVGVREIIGKLQ